MPRVRVKVNHKLGKSRAQQRRRDCLKRRVGATAKDHLLSHRAPFLKRRPGFPLCLHLVWTQGPLLESGNLTMLDLEDE